MPKNIANDSVSERRLRPIYDWLDNGNNKKALQEADKVLKKHPDFECCQVLKCLALMRLGRDREASQILDKVLAGNPVDEGSLNAMTIAYRELQEPDKICRMYEGAVCKEPHNEEFLTHLFMSYVRMGEYKKQEEAARNLYKVKPKNPYYFWSVMSLVLQAIEGDPKLGKAIHLPLAHKKVQKMAHEDKMDQEQEVLLYILVLELREAWTEGLQVLDGKLGKKLAASASYRNFCRTKRLDFELVSEHWAEVGRLAREELEIHPDQWSDYKHYLTAIKKLKESSDPCPLGFSVQDALTLVKNQQSNHNDLRGPWLAELELLAVLGDHITDISLPNLVLQYFEKFGTKHVTFSDLRPYISLLSREEKDELVTKLTQQWEGVPATQAEIGRDINLRAIQRFCGGHRSLTASETEAEVVLLMDRWRAVQPLVVDMLSTDLRVSDNYLVLAGHILWDLWRSSGLSNHFLRAATLLHIGLAASPSNWQLMLLLIRLYGAAGCGSVSSSLHGSLDIKHLMLDSLGWLLPRQLWGSAHLQLSLSQLTSTVRLYNHVNKDTADHIITAYRSGTFYQIRDIYRLRSRITNSHHFASVDSEIVLVQLLLEVSQHSQAVALLANLNLELDAHCNAWDRLEDNRDLSTMVSWDPPDLQVQTHEFEDSFHLEVQFARCRHLLLRCLAATTKLSEGVDNAMTHISSLISSLKSHWTVCQTSVAAINPPALIRPQAPEVPRLVPYSKCGQMEVVILLLELFPVLACPDNNSGSSVLTTLRTITSLLPGLSEGVDTESCRLNLWARGEVMEIIMWKIETISLVATLLGALIIIVSSTTGKPAKKGRKGKPAVLPAFQPLVKDFSLLHEAVETTAVKLETHIKDLERVLNESNLTDSLDMLSLAVEEGKLGDAVEEGEQGKEVLTRMEKSYVESLQEMSAVLKNKQSYLNSYKIIL